MPNPKCGPFDLKSLWQDSLRRGLFGRIMGSILGLRDSEDLLADALLQDVAVPLLAKELPDDYLELLESRNEETHRLSNLERERFGWNHADTAALMARSWSLPKEFAELISSHVGLESAVESKSAGKIAVSLSALLPAATDSHWHEREQFDETYHRLRPDGALSAADLMGQVDNKFAEFAPILKLATPARSLAEQ